MRTQSLCVSLLALVLASAAIAEHPIAEAQRHQRAANAAYEAGDYEEFTRSMERAYELNPASFPTRYNLACGYARTGRADAALDLLEQLTLAQVDFGMARDPDLESLRELPRFRELVATLEASIVPISNSSELATIEQYGISPEGIALDKETGRIFFGSMRTGQVYALEPGGGYAEFASVGEHGPYAAIGMTVDNDAGVLWTVGTWFFMAVGFDADSPQPSGLFGFDLASGELRHHYPVDVSVTGLNDVAVAPNGDVYVSGGALHVLKSGGDALQPVITMPEPFGSNGLTVHPDGSMLFVSSYPVGIGAIDLTSGELRYLDAPPDRPLYGIDGLYWHDGALVGIQNGIQPWRVLRVDLNSNATAVSDVQVIEFANDALLAMTGAIDGDRIHYVGRAAPPENRPSQFPESLAPFLGKTVIMTAPLNPP